MAGRRDFDTDVVAYLQDVGKYCDTVLLDRADQSDNGEFFPDIIRQFADLGLLELMFDEQRNLQLHRMRLVHQTTELVAAAFPAAPVAPMARPRSFFSRQLEMNAARSIVRTRVRIPIG